MDRHLAFTAAINIFGCKLQERISPANIIISRLDRDG
jgi:hypothetical protein